MVVLHAKGRQEKCVLTIRLVCSSSRIISEGDLPVNFIAFYVKSITTIQSLIGFLKSLLLLFLRIQARGFFPPVKLASFTVQLFFAVSNSFDSNWRWSCH